MVSRTLRLLLSVISYKYIASGINLTNYVYFISGVVALFTLPKVYETNQEQIDQNLALVQAKINEITAK